MDSIRVSEAPDSSSILDEATKTLIRPISALLRLGVFHYWTWVSEERAAKGDKGELSIKLPQTLPHFTPNPPPNTLVNRAYGKPRNGKPYPKNNIVNC